MSEDRKPSVEAALDLLVYAPLGFALEARGLLPKFVERGKNQVTMARMVGQFAVQQGQVEASKRLGPVQEQVETVLADLGLVPRPSSTAADTPDPDPAEVAPDPVVELVPEPAVDVAPLDPSFLDPSELAIPDYDSLAASQVVPRLRALAPAELEAVRAYEAAGRGRKTILNRIAQLQAG
ncbi:MAG TPA: hypothetical protein VF228_04735 [Iamia sp.]